MKLFSYVVEHDRGYAPNPYGGFCTLRGCKYRKCPCKPRNVVELADPGDWVVGTGGKGPRSAGHGKLVYAMQIEEKMTREQYYNDRRFQSKLPLPHGRYEQQQGDNVRPGNSFEREEQFVLISRLRFYYFGRNAIDIPCDTFPRLEKQGPGFKVFDDAYAARFERWITRKEPGLQGEPCMKEPAKERDGRTSKSCC